MYDAQPMTVPRGRFQVPAATGLCLDRLLHRAIDGSSQLVLVTAPAGSGKTTLLAQAAQGQRVAWCHAGPADASAPALVRHLSGAVTLALDGAPHPVASDDELLAALERTTEPLTIMIDDAHAIAGTEAEEALGRFFDLLPTHVRVLVGARFELVAATTRARLAGKVVDIDADQLRFRSWEVERLFRDCYRQPLPPEDAAALSRHTDGWIAGLQMFHLATRDKPLADRRHAVASLLGRSRLLRSYLTATVLATLPADIADFLVRSSALVVMDGALCDRLLGRRDGQAVLEELAARNLFTTRTEDGWYFRFHSVLQAQLETMLSERLGAAGARAWYRRAGALLEETNHWAEAYRAYARAEDWSAANRLLYRQGADAMLPRTVSALFADDPWITLARARGCRASGRLDAAIEAYRLAEGQFEAPQMKRVCRSERRELDSWTDARAVSPTGELWTEWLRFAVSGAPDRLLAFAARRGEPPWRLALGLGILLAGRPHDALPVLRNLGHAGSGFVNLAAQLSHSITTAMLGWQHEFDLDDVASAARAAGVPWLARMSRAARALDSPALRAEATAVRLECDADDDRWGVLLAGFCEFVAVRNAGLQTEPVLSSTVEYAERLGAPALGDWAQRVAAAGSTRQRRAHIVIRCLGRLCITIDGQDRDWQQLRPRAQHVLGMLMTRLGRAVPEETLTGALWPELAVDQGRRSLQVAVSAVRRLLEPAVAIQRRGTAYLLVVGPEADVDLRVFAQATSRDHPRTREMLRVALRAYGGSLLPEFGPAEWLVAERDRLAFAAARAATALAGLELEAGESVAACDACRTALGIDPSHDQAWRLLVTAQERAGNVASAQRTRRAYAAVLADLGVASPAAVELDLGERRGGPLVTLPALHHR